MLKKIVILLAAAAVIAIPPVWEALKNAAALLASLDVERVVEYIRSFGVWGPIISFCLMVFQSVAAPLPAFLITFANAAVFGWVFGAILSWSSAMVGALLCFAIAKYLGRGVVEKLTSKAALNSVDGFFDRHGKYAILIARLLPFISFDIVSYAAGLTSMRLGPFLLATGLGQLPATIIYSYVGGMLTGGVKYFVLGLLCLFSLSVLVYALKQYYNAKRTRSEAAAAQPEGTAQNLRAEGTDEIRLPGDTVASAETPGASQAGGKAS